jgi:hypothetical protein
MALILLYQRVLWLREDALEGPVRLGVLTTTHALFAMKVQRKVRNGVADFVAADQSGSVPNLSDAAGNRRISGAPSIIA